METHFDGPSSEIDLTSESLVLFIIEMLIGQRCGCFSWALVIAFLDTSSVRIRIYSNQLTLSKRVELAHKGSKNESGFRQIVDQMRPHAAQRYQNVSDS